jgi:hypothetical protein
VLPGCTNSPGAANRAVAAGDRRRHHQSRVGHAVGHDLVDLVVGLAENTHRIPRRPQVALGGLLVGHPLVQIMLRDRARLIEFSEALQIAGQQVQHAGRGDQVGVGGEQVRAVDGEQGLPLFHLIADLGERVDDLALIRREDLDRHLLVEVDAADRGLLDRKIVFSDRPDLDRGHLLIIERHAGGVSRPYDS